MPEFTLVPSKRFEDDFRTLPKEVQSRVLRALSLIQADPFRGQKLKGVAIGRWRYRVGDYRIRYDIEGSAIYLHIVRHRKEVYR